MRTLLFLTILLISGTSFIYAGSGSIHETEKSKVLTTETDPDESFNAAIWHREDGTVSVNFKKKEDETVIVKLYNASETLILQDKFNRHNLVTYKYDLSRLPKGNYYFEVTNKKDVLRKEISVK